MAALPPPPPPQLWYPYPYYQPPKDNSKLVLILVLVVVFAVALPIILAAILYVMITGLLGALAPPAPIPGFGPWPPGRPFANLIFIDSELLAAETIDASDFGPRVRP